MDPILLDNITRETKREPKMALLTKLPWSTRRFLKLACDPMVTFGVTVDFDHQYQVWQKTTARATHQNYSDDLHELCERLMERRLTGTAAQKAIEGVLSRSPTKGHFAWACSILNKKLRAGFTASTLNKIWPGFIEEFEVALATPYDPGKHEIVGRWFVEPKLDGLRMVVVGGKAYTRNGHQIESVDHILNEIGSYLNLSQWVLDGEIMGAGDFDESSGQIRRKDGDKGDLYYNVFDMMPAYDWNARNSQPFETRRMYNVMGQLSQSAHVRIVPSGLVEFSQPATPAQLNSFCEQFIAQGFEGAMLKDATAKYEWKRGLSILKLKKMETTDARITGTYEGKGKHKGRLGGIMVDIDGIATKVGSGFDDAQREDLWKRRNEIVDQMVEVQYQNKTRDGSLRFPVFLKFRGDKT